MAKKSFLPAMDDNVGISKIRNGRILPFELEIRSLFHFSERDKKTCCRAIQPHAAVSENLFYFFYLA